jgi:hypothetical protein
VPINEEVLSQIHPGKTFIVYSAPHQTGEDTSLFEQDIKLKYEKDHFCRQWSGLKK